MKKIVLIAIASIFVLSFQAKTQKTMNYKQLWEKVIQLEEKSLPKSAAEEVSGILRKAIAEKNSPQVIKALIHQAKYEMAIDEENDTLVFHNLNDMLLRSDDVVEKSVLHSLLGELYLQYWERDEWEINERTELDGFVPVDMKEWTRNNFFDKVSEHLNASILPRDLLERAQVEEYGEVVLLGKDARTYFPSMYDFLTLRAIDLFSGMDEDADLSRSLAQKNITQQSLFAPVADYIGLDFDVQPGDYNLLVLEAYKKLLLSLSERNLSESVVLTEINKLDYLAKLPNAYNSYALPSLQAMYQKWESYPVSVEIIDKIAEFNEQEINEIPQEQRDKQLEKKKELYDLLQNAIKRYPNYNRISVLENRLYQLESPLLQVNADPVFGLKEEKKITVDYRNIQKLTVRIYRLDSALPALYAKNRRDNHLNETKKLVREFDVTLPAKQTYETGQTDVSLDIAEYGAYKLEFETNPPLQKKSIVSDFYFTVSDLAVFSRNSETNRYEFFVVDRTSGEPVKNATVNIYKLPGNWNNSAITVVKSLAVDQMGMASYHKDIPNNDVFYQAVHNEDNGSELNRLPWNYYQYSGSDRKSSENVTIFTDRAIYRPGQTVSFKAIATNTVGDQSKLLSGKSIEFMLRDANFQEVSKQTLRTNEYGSAAGEFLLPQGLLTGDYSIVSANGSVHFKVEEYKRPTFEVTFDTISQTYKFGEEIKLMGSVENFSGIKLQDADVCWRITRQQSWWWRWGWQPPQYFGEGVSKTDEDGRFTIVFTPQKSDEFTSSRAILTFNIEATVTDVNGETQVGNYSVTVGDISMILDIDMPIRLEKSSPDKIMVIAKNLDGSDIKASGSYQLFSLHENDSINLQVYQGDFKTGEQPELKTKLKSLPSGKYRIKLQSKDDRGNDITAEKDFILFGYNDKRPAVKTNEWFIVKKATMSPGKFAEVLFGATDKLNVLYELWQSDTLVERKWIQINNENRLILVTYKPEYKSGVTLMLTYVKEGLFYQQSALLSLEKEKKGLNVTLDVFRDKIRPGGNEEWKLSFKDAAGNPAIAEVLASMYDFSLDQVYPAHGWSLSLPDYSNRKSVSPLQSDLSFQKRFMHGYFVYKNKEVSAFEFDRFNWFNFSLYNYGGGMGRMLFASPTMRSSTSGVVYEMADQSTEQEMAKDSKNALEESVVVGFAAQKSEQREEGGESSTAPQIRRNFNETAFFYPQLTTNAQGETLISFTVPESNTRWRFRVLAHDKNLNTGAAEGFTVSQKELMVTPNIPRFLRHGDNTGIATKISNLSENPISGKVTLEFFNPITEEVINSIDTDNRSIPFDLAVGASSDVSWNFYVPKDFDLLGVRIIARSESFSDGEQHALAVLPNRMLVSESMRLDVNGTETKTFKMDRLADNNSATAQNYRLTLEFTSNPAWYAVQALPLLSTPESDNAVSWFAAYYANILGMHIGKSYPKVAAVIDAWKKQGGTSETLLSNLEKNEELKNVLLEETPWVLEAKDESEQKQQLSLLFDLNRNQNRVRQSIDKLSELQTTQGGWSWFKGFYPSRSITQYILYGFSQLKELNALELNEKVVQMQDNAVDFIDSEALDNFNRMKSDKNWQKRTTIPVSELEYLYVRWSYDEYPLSNELKEMTDFYASVIEKNWTKFNLYERSLIAVLMHKQGKQRVANEIMASYREHATLSDEMGMYWANNRSHVFMSQSAISVHTFVMDAFRVNGASPSEMDNMKRWLLKQNHTQQWESTHATMDAVYALLSTGSDWFSGENKTTLTVGNKVIEPRSEDIATGYFKEAWHQTEIVPQMAHVKVDNQGDAPAWGALYWQYYEELDKITKTDASIDVEKLLFVEKTDASGTKLVPVNEDKPLKVGDKVVVRLTVRADRDLEFVHLKDMRAAAFEPVEQLSGMKWQGETLYYQTSKDASTNFYFDHLPRGTYVFEYGVYVTRSGSYANGISTIQCMYAPEFTSHTAGIRVQVEK